MAKQLTQDFVERRIHPLTIQPVEWGVETKGSNYELDLKMCQLRELVYSFHWGDEREPLSRLSSVIDTPSRILKMDISLNELSSLEHESFIPFQNLRELNASLNKINKFIGIEVLKKLYSLNLSHNSISRIENLVRSSSLVELNLSMNELEDISYMPGMMNLKILNLNNNKIKSLDGVQALPQLRELYAQRNEVTEVIPLTSCFHLQILNLSGNRIHTLHNAVGVFGQLKKLDVLSLHGNPIDRDRLYQTEILRETNIKTLDNISVRPLPKPTVSVEHDPGASRHIQNINALKDAAKQAFEERMKESRAKMEENINFLQRRIVSLQNEYIDYEEKLKTDLDACLRYLDNLSATESTGVHRDHIRDSIGTPHPKVWQGRKSRPQEYPKTDYSSIKDTDRLLQFASKELSRGGT
ncbi:toll-like receptor Tollo [Ostrea edulis]|uniref:toll-like receptor Tollo n=1 Tax=Ostrea edulis TaxID=37623 RepID=UPI0020952960|nr:toll-like receptor Tollo [Ostrea edulis]XP_048761101.1 toll-like receptor Tollo [Ostrea edulis]